MSKRKLSTEERMLEERLRGEANELRPSFSESLHRRIMCAVREHHAAMAGPHDRAVMARPWRRGLAAVLAAACLLGVAAVGWQLYRSAQRQGVPVDPPQIAGPSIEDLRVIDEWTDRAATGIDGLMATAAFKPQADQLKHDAKLVADKLLDPLPLDVKLASEP
jgi:hypothetical protein